MVFTLCGTLIFQPLQSKSLSITGNVIVAKQGDAFSNSSIGRPYADNHNVIT